PFARLTRGPHACGAIVSGAPNGAGQSPHGEPCVLTASSEPSPLSRANAIDVVPSRNETMAGTPSITRVSSALVTPVGGPSTAQRLHALFAEPPAPDADPCGADAPLELVTADWPPMPPCSNALRAPQADKKAHPIAPQKRTAA